MSLRDKIAMKDIGRFEIVPYASEHPRRQGKIIATGSQGTAIDRSRGSASDQRKRIAMSLNPFDLTNAFQDTGLIGAPGATSRHYQTDRILHLLPSQVRRCAQPSSNPGGIAAPTVIC